MSLIWHQFFSTKDLDDNSVQFNLDTLARMGHEERKEVFSAFFYSVYYQYYKENGLSYKNMYDPSLLKAFGLPADANLDDIKERFRVLAKKYHPDNGGDAQDFIKVIEAYEQIKSHD
ncbi:DnaJ domain-containing protein [Vallitalea pronyensis]|uniref:DnaJ domain-containing protein n=1 Tax=Vallitalea pronyensis TaxID=1348613 RepID=A0A8J8SIE5_9FIRM|nr:DnaJ domain-containing protein [Vallitalea pronyensis]QUI24372.1 DnaJ domain-containing protein [Vallitalea pronyensis]